MLTSAKPDNITAPTGGSLPHRFAPFTAATVCLVLLFTGPFRHLVNFALNDTLYSHILLIPFVSLYLVFSDRQILLKDAAPARQVSWFSVLAVALGLAGYAWGWHSAPRLSENDYLTVTTLSFLACFLGVCDQFLGRETVRANAFPIGFLFFIVPFPIALRTAIETFMQHGSAVMAEWLFQLSGMSVLRTHFDIQLPGFRMEVAPECSGIHSSWVLFITSLMAGYLFLRTPWKRAALAAAVLPLAILRNGFRIFVIGQLCVHYGPQMIDSPIHHRGGPLFFALSLVPLFLWLLILRRSDRRPTQPSGT
jgi:exosortase C (VPDSG-CTERM-specific)